MSDDKTPQHEALLSIQDIILSLPEERQTAVYMYAEDMRDILTEGGQEAFLALTLVSLEFAATNAELDKEGTDDDSVIDG